MENKIETVKEKNLEEIQEIDNRETLLEVKKLSKLYGNEKKKP